jgi:hypothetical protein
MLSPAVGVCTSMHVEAAGASAHAAHAAQPNLHTNSAGAQAACLLHRAAQRCNLLLRCTAVGCLLQALAAAANSLGRLTVLGP